MGFNPDGTFVRSGGRDKWKGDAASPDPRIKSGDHDTHDNELADGIGDCLNRRGLGGALANLSMGGHRITNVGEPDPGSPQDVATKHYVDTMAGWPTHKDISGADAEGRLNFTSLTGVNGITWSSIQASWVAKKANADNAHERNRVVLNSSLSPQSSGTDVIGIDATTGALMWPATANYMSNLVMDPLGNWRVPTAGSGGLFQTYAGGFAAWGHSVATSTAYAPVTLDQWYSAAYSGGSVVQTFNKKASGNGVALYGYTNSVARWLIYLGDSAAESGSNAGSNLGIYAYGDTGAYVGQAIQIYRSNAKVNFPAGLTGTLSIENRITSAQYAVLEGLSGYGMLAGNVGAGVTAIYLRPNGSGVSTGQVTINQSGDMGMSGEFAVNVVGTPSVSNNGIHAGVGLQDRGGVSGGYDATRRGNFAFNTGSSAPMIYINDSGYTLTVACDYRIKQEVKPLASTWDKVKTLRPVSYQFRDLGEYRADGKERWGFVAHELQESLLPTAASGVLDEEEDSFETTVDDDGVEQTRAVGKRPFLQTPDLMAIIAALTSALQEAQLRIEALEARA